MTNQDRILKRYRARVRAIAAPDVVALRAALAHLYQTYVVDLHGPQACDCDPSVGIDTCAPCEARAALFGAEE